MKNIILIFTIAITVIITSCEKEQEVLINEEIATEVQTEKSAIIVTDVISIDNAMADINFESDFYFIAENKLTEMFSSGMKWGRNDSLRYRLGQCPDFSVESENGEYPKIITINYGDGTQLNNGRIMSGSMLINITKTDIGFTVVTSYDNFSIDSIGITGTSVMVYSGRFQNGGNSTGTQDLMITLPNGKTINRVSEITREWMSGSVSDLNQTDDTMRITGYVISTFNIDEIEVVYRKDIIVPLIKTSGCRYFSSGVIEITQNGIVVTKLSYGDGDCDNVAILMETGKDAVEIVLSENDDYFNKGSKITSEMTGDHQNQGNTMGHDSTYTDNENHNSGMSQDSTNTNNKNHESENKKQGHGGSKRD